MWANLLSWFTMPVINSLAIVSMSRGRPQHNYSSVALEFDQTFGELFHLSAVEELLGREGVTDGIADASDGIVKSYGILLVTSANEQAKDLLERRTCHGRLLLCELRFEQCDPVGLQV